MIRVFTGHTPEEIINADLSFIEKIGLKEHLSPTRSNGLASMIKQIKYFAMAWNLKNSNNGTSRNPDCQSPQKCI
jgi:cysteine desulfuration protein SufE